MYVEIVDACESCTPTPPHILPLFTYCKMCECLVFIYMFTKMAYRRHTCLYAEIEPSRNSPVPKCIDPRIRENKPKTLLFSHGKYTSAVHSPTRPRIFLQRE